MTTIASIRLGKLEGSVEHGLHVFRGIPYAAPPVGPLRFRAPQSPQPWLHVRDARTPTPTAPQLMGLMRDVPAQSEDCLRLNVWTPGLHGQRPVMVFIHGGAFTTGTSAHAMYDGWALARRGDVVVVTVNYRLGVLGFVDLAALGEGGFAAEANNGLRDQVAALRWVREHIADFGGDPSNVTVFGQSAGGMSTASLLAAPAARGLFSRVIAQSGAAHHVTSREDSARIARVWLDALHVSPRELHSLRALPVERLVQAQAACLRESVHCGLPERPLHNAGMTLVPVVDGDSLLEVPIAAIAAGRAADVPVLVGSTRDEWRFWVVLMDTSKQSLDAAALRKVIDRRVPGHADRVLDAYARHRSHHVPWKAYAAIETDRVFRVPALRMAQARAQLGKPAFLYTFDFTGPMFEGELGACHTMDVPVALGLVDEGFGQVFTGGGPDAQRLSQRMMDAWVAFARSGDPSTEALGTWPAYQLAEPQRMRLGARCGAEPSSEGELDSVWDALI